MAGGASSTVSGLDGMATTVYLPSPQALWVDTLGGILITDSTACTIRYLSVSGTITTVAGQYQSCSVGDGIGTNIRFAGPIALTADSIGRTYIADLDNVRIMSTSGVYRQHVLHLILLPTYKMSDNRCGDHALQFRWCECMGSLSFLG